VLTAKHISLEKVHLGDAHLMQFCKRVQRLFGRESITPNMHMHCHLRSCILEYGPLHGFWLYAFERYNGLLGAMPHNNRSIEVQMDRFLRDNEVFGADLPDEFADDFKPLFPREMLASGSLADTLNIERPSNITGWTIDAPGLLVSLPVNYSRQVFNQTEVDFLTELYTKLYKVPRSALIMSRSFKQYSSAKLNGVHFGSHKTRSDSSSIAIAVWDNVLFGSSPTMPCTPTSVAVFRTVRIDAFCKHVVEVHGEYKTHLLVSLSWFRRHPKNTEFGKPTTVWYHDLFELYGIHSIIPVQFLRSRSVSLIQNLDGESVLFVCPCLDFL